MRTQEQNRLKQADPAVRPYLEATELITTHDKLGPSSPMRQVPEAWHGAPIDTTSVGNSRHPPEWNSGSASHRPTIAALVGVAPLDRQSGQHRGQPRSAADGRHCAMDSYLNQ